MFVFVWLQVARCLPSPSRLVQMGKISFFFCLNSIPLYICTTSSLAFPGGTEGKELSCQCRRVGKIPSRRAWQRIAVFLPGQSHGQRSLAGYSPSGCRELDTTEVSEDRHAHLIFFILSSVDWLWRCFYVLAVMWRVGYDWATELNWWTLGCTYLFKLVFLFFSERYILEIEYSRFGERIDEGEGCRSMGGNVYKPWDVLGF